MEDQFTYQGSPIEPWTRVVHPWLGAAVEGFASFMFPPSRGFWILGGWLLWAALIYMVCKSLILLAGILLLVALFVLTATWDLLSYPLRKHYGFS